MSAPRIIDRAAFESKLRLMGLRRLTVLVIGSSLTVAACRSGDDGSASSTSKNRGSGAEGAAAAASSIPWFPGAEPMLLLPAHSTDRSLVALADSSAAEYPEGLLDTSGTFLRLDGSRISARVSIAQGSEGCIEGALDPAPSSPWGVGFIGGAPVSLAVDSLRGLPRRDSSALTRVVFRLASRVPNDAGGRFSGLPFVLVDLWRLRLPDGGVVVVATTKRQINQEDSPLEERTFVVAESDTTATEGYSLVLSGRSSGAEETVESRELLAAVMFAPSPALHLVVAHDFGHQTSYSIAERLTRGRWVVRWASRRFSC